VASVTYVQCEYETSQRKTARYLGLNRSTMTYKRRPSKDEHLKRRMKELATKHRRFGLPRIHFLLKREKLVRSKSEEIFIRELFLRCQEDQAIFRQRLFDGFDRGLASYEQR
jgi:hypothetical protein